MRILTILLLSFVVVRQAQSAARLLHFEHAPDREISYKAIDCRLEGIAKGVLILVPGCNGDGRDFLSEERWVEFATRNRLALVGVSFKSPTDLLKDRKGYYDASRGSGRALLSLLEKAGLSGRPLLMFGFSGGAHFVSSFVEEYPERVIAWCAHSAAWWGMSRRGATTIPPGIVACGGDDMRLGASLSYFKDGRSMGRRLSWVEIPSAGHIRNTLFEDFTREYFKEILVMGKKIGQVWIDLGCGEMIKGKSVCAESNRSWMPSQRIYHLWRQLVVSNADRVVVHRVQTHSSIQRQLTLCFRMPERGDAKGVLCVCLLANKPEDVRWRLQCSAHRDEFGRLVAFAETNQLAVVAWGSTSGLWNPRVNWNALEREEEKTLDKEFDHVAEAWERAIGHLSRKYGLPRGGYLLWGYSGAAQYAQRLALRKPRLFRAIHIHIASSYDLPVPEGQKILWCVTTGENENGYERSLDFFAEARRSGYPIVYKAYPGLGHVGCREAELLGIECFRLALRWADNDNGWRMLFEAPSFWGDVVNQTVWKHDEINMIPESFRTALPSESIVQAWRRM